MVRQSVRDDTISISILRDRSRGGSSVYCHRCGAPNDDLAAFCDKCGTAIRKTGPDTGAPAPDYPIVVQYAGFWRRLAATLIDGLLLGSAWFALAVTIGVVYVAVTGQETDEWSDSTRHAIVYLSWIASAIPGWLYYASMESSSRQATLGKMALGIIVTDAQGRRVSFSKASGRFFGRILSGIILYIGYIMIAFTEKKQGLHDIMANCLVVVKKK
jgi:uncharacterized RDD family membrane protein YckC